MACVNGRKKHRWNKLDISGPPQDWELRWCDHCGSLAEFYKGKKQPKITFQIVNWKDYVGDEIATPKYFGKIPLEEYKD